MKLTLKEIAKAVKGTIEEKYQDLTVDAISTDTREDLAGKLFVAIRGENFDGNTYIDSAFEKGAVCCIAERTYPNQAVIQTSDTRKALIHLAEYYKSKFQIPTVAVTGSAGKTTTKDLIASILSEKYKVLKTEGNFNNEIGLPHTVFRLDDSIEVLVLEMGMNHFGEIHNLSFIAKPNIAVITNIGVSHIENLGSQEGILKAKSEIFDYLAPDGIAVLNFEDEWMRKIKEKWKTIWYGKDVYATEVQTHSIEGMSCRIHGKGESFLVNMKQSGHHMLMNTLAAVSVGLELGLSVKQIQKGIETFEPAKMRANVIVTEKFQIIDDVYNANPTSVKAAIDVLRQASGRKVCILGDMLELGTYAEEMHREIGEYTAKSELDLVIAIGESSYYVYEGAGRNCEYFKTKEEWMKHGKALLKAGDTILVKASRGMRFEKIVEEITRCGNG